MRFLVLTVFLCLSPFANTTVFADALEGKHVLIVDDDEVTARLMARIISEWGARSVAAAYSAQEALALLTSGRRFDVVLTDYNMPPGITGGKLAQRIAELNIKVPLLLYTGSPEIPKQEAVLFRAILAKPASIRELHSSLADVVSAAPIVLDTETDPLSGCSENFQPRS